MKGCMKRSLRRKHTAATSLKANLEHKAGKESFVVDNMSGSESKSPVQSPRQRRKSDSERGSTRNKKDSRERYAGRKGIESSNIILCFNCDKVTTHFAITCPEPKKEGRSTTPYPRSGSNSREPGSQGSEKHRTNILRGSWGKEPLGMTRWEVEEEMIQSKERERVVEELIKFKLKTKRKRRR